MAYTLIQIRCGESMGEETRITQTEVPDFRLLNRFVGGPLETVPFFDHFEGKRAVAFCDEEGKLMGKPVNQVATALWFREIGSAMAMQLQDVLVGNIVIIQCDTDKEMQQL